MQHDLIFLIGGPALGSGVCFFVLLPLISILGGDWHAYNLSMFISYVITLPLALVLGVVPAGLACIVDAKLLRYKVGYHHAWCAAFGFVIGFLPLAPSFLAISSMARTCWRLAWLGRYRPEYVPGGPMRLRGPPKLELAVVEFPTSFLCRQCLSVLGYEACCKAREDDPIFERGRPR